MCGTEVGSEFLVTLLYVVLLHFLKRVPHVRVRGAEQPGAFRTSPALEILTFDVDDLPSHSLEDIQMTKER
jgi:hypothetical protein